MDIQISSLTISPAQHPGDIVSEVENVPVWNLFHSKKKK